MDLAAGNKIFKSNIKNIPLLYGWEVLNSLGISWEELQNKIDPWLGLNTQHPHYNIMLDFKNESYKRKTFDLKDIRNDLISIIGKNIAWQVVVGKTIGSLIAKDKFVNPNEHSIYSYLGNKFVREVFGLKMQVTDQTGLIIDETAEAI